MNLKPLGKNVIVSVMDGGKVTDSGIVLSVSIEPDRGVVEAIGSEVKELTIGDQVFLDWNRTVEIQGTDYRLTSEDNVIFVYGDKI